MPQSIKHRISEGELGVNIILDKADNGWQMMIVDDEGIATQWEDSFNSQDDALAEGKAAIAEQGIRFFIGTGV